MKVGDLVRYKQEVQGLGALTGIVVGFRGDAPPWPIVHWNQPRLQTDSSVVRVTYEMPGFIEVVNESR